MDDLATWETYAQTVPTLARRAGRWEETERDCALVGRRGRRARGWRIRGTTWSGRLVTCAPRRRELIRPQNLVRGTQCLMRVAPFSATRELRGRSHPQSRLRPHPCPRHDIISAAPCCASFAHPPGGRTRQHAGCRRAAPLRDGTAGGVRLPRAAVRLICACLGEQQLLLPLPRLSLLFQQCHRAPLRLQSPLCLGSLNDVRRWRWWRKSRHGGLPHRGILPCHWPRHRCMPRHRRLPRRRRLPSGVGRRSRLHGLWSPRPRRFMMCRELLSSHLAQLELSRLARLCRLGCCSL